MREAQPLEPVDEVDLLVVRADLGQHDGGSSGRGHLGDGVLPAVEEDDVGRLQVLPHRVP